MEFGSTLRGSRSYALFGLLGAVLAACGRSDLRMFPDEDGASQGGSGGAVVTSGASAGGRTATGGTTTTVGTGGLASPGVGGGPLGGYAGTSGASAGTAAGAAGGSGDTFAGSSGTGGDGGVAGTAPGGAGGTEQAGTSGTGGTTLGPAVELCEPAFTPDLDGPPAVDAGSEVLGGAVADFNGDGRLDLATALSYGDVGVLFGNGDGTFAPVVTYAAGLDPVGPGSPHSADLILARDLDQNGTLDLVTIHIQSSNLAVLLGNGDGTFASGIVTPLRAEAWQLVLGDFDADTLPDAAIATRGPDGNPALNVLFGNGDGTFGTEVELFGASTIRGIAGGDLNEDGRTDLVCAGFEVWRVFTGGEDRSFTVQADDGFYASPGIDDMNGDGHLDLALPTWCGPAQYPDGHLHVRFGNGDGTFSSSTDYDTLGCHYDVTFADANGDDIIDLVTPPSVVMLGNGDGSFQPEVVSPDTMGGTLVGVGDWNGDGLLDIATASSSWVSVRLGNGDGSFGRITEVSTGLEPGVVLLADLDSDGVLDLATPNYDSRMATPEASSVSVLLGAGDGGFLERVDYAASPVPRHLAATDLDHDGWLDLVARGSDNISILLGAGDGRYQPYTELSAADYTRELRLGDVNGDFHTDLVMLNDWSASLDVRLGYGDGTFAPSSPQALVTSPSAGTLFDFDGDDRLDLAFTDYVYSEVRVLLGDGAGGFSEASTFATSAGPYHVENGDFDGDGNGDLVTAGNELISLHFGNGDGSFGRRVDYTGFSPLQGVDDIVVLDFDRDTHLDIVLSSRGIRILLGAGDGTFRCFEHYALGGDTGWLGIGDLNGDGRNDIATTTYDGVEVFLNSPR